MNPWEEIKRHARLKTIRKANRKSRHRKKVLVEMLQGRIEFFTRTNEQWRQNNDVLEGLLIWARNNLWKQQQQQITQNALVAYWLAMVGLGTTTMTTTTNRGSDPDVSDSVPHSGEHIIVDDDHDDNGGGKETSHGSGGACMHPVNNDDRPHLPGSRRRPERDNEPPRGIARGPRSVVDGREEARMRRGGGVTTTMTGGGRGDGTVDRRCPCPSSLEHRQTTTDMDDIDVPMPALSQFSHSSDDDDIVDGRGGACGSGEQNSFQPGMNYEKTTLMRAADSEMEKPKETSNDDDLDGMERMRSVSSLSSNKDDLGGRGSRGSELPTNNDEQCAIDALRSLRKKLAVDVSDVRFIILNQIHLNNYTHCIFSFTC